MRTKIKNPRVEQYRVILEYNNGGFTTTTWTQKQIKSIMVHELKTHQPYFEEILMGVKKFEVRKDDRGFNVGDTLILKEVEFYGAGMTDHDLTQFYTGRQCNVIVTSILNGGKFGVNENYVIMSIILDEKRINQ